MNSHSDVESSAHWRIVQQDVGILGDSIQTRQLLETIEQVAPTDISVLVSGESGTGKELVAKAVHMRSKRRNEPLITVNCGAIPEGILESELFGHEKGSFTGAAAQRKGYFELADHGSIFLDEIGELPLAVQAKLLRVLENREFMRVGGTITHTVDIRFIAATNRNLEQEVRKGNFRQDLYFRLNAMHIYVPSLKERRQDIPILAEKFGRDFSKQNLIEYMGISDAGIIMLQNHSWPGNIRELRNMIEKMIVLERGRKINEEIVQKYLAPFDTRESGHNMPATISRPKDELNQELLLRALLEIKTEIAQLRELFINGMTRRAGLPPGRDHASPYVQFVEEQPQTETPESVSGMEREMIVATLKKTNGNKRKAAKILGMSERTLYRKLNKYELRENDD